MNNILFSIVGLTAGCLSGLLGIGGGIILIPVFMFLFGMSQHQAQGTTLALMVPPIGLLAAWEYYKHGYVDLRIAGFVCLGFFIGGLFGAKIAAVIPDTPLEKIFGVVMLLVSLKMIFSK
jgi:hypothetical protein